MMGKQKLSTMGLSRLATMIMDCILMLAHAAVQELEEIPLFMEMVLYSFNSRRMDQREPKLLSVGNDSFRRSGRENLAV